MANDDTLAPSSGRQEKTRRFYINQDGERSPRAGLDSVAFRVEFVGTDEVIELSFDDLTAEVQRAAALYGALTSLTNTVGSAKLSLDEMLDNARDRLDVFLSGRWSSETRGGGPRTADLLEAAARWYSEKGKTFTDDDRAKMQAKLTDEASGTKYRSDLLAIAKFRAFFEAIKAERAAARARQAQDVSGRGSDPDSLI